jgi:hypothetical protein
MARMDDRRAGMRSAVAVTGGSASRNPPYDNRRVRFADPPYFSTGARGRNWSARASAVVTGS